MGGYPWNPVMKDKLIKLLQLSQSSNDYEALSAIRKANAVLRAKNMDWNQFFSHALPQGPRTSGIQVTIIPTGSWTATFTKW
jgi:hypothetical protein